MRGNSQRPKLHTAVMKTLVHRVSRWDTVADGRSPPSCKGTKRRLLLHTAATVREHPLSAASTETPHTSMLCGRNAEINVQPGGAYNNHCAWKVNQPAYVAVSSVRRSHRLTRLWLVIYVTVLEACERRYVSAPRAERMWPLLVCAHTFSQDSNIPDINPLIQSNFPPSHKQ